MHLGVLRKNEQYEEEMVDLLEWLHRYVPGHDEENVEAVPVKTLNGGDYLTYERHQGAQSSMQDARTPSTQLSGLLGKFEDFHTQCEWLKVNKLLLIRIAFCAIQKKKTGTYILKNTYTTLSKLVLSPPPPKHTKEILHWFFNL